MNDPSAANPAMDATPNCSAKLTRLSLMVQRLLDADLLLVEEGEALLAEIAAADRAVAGGNETAVRRHLRRFVRTLEALMGSQMLDVAGGRAALGAARRMLEASAG
jgi:hypothetical protein